MIDEDIKNTLLENNIDVVSKIGQGGFASCYKVFSQRYKQFFACKVLTLDQKRESKQQSFKNECDALTNFIHPNIIHVFKTIHTETHQFIILEYCPNGDLEAYIRKHGPISDINQFYMFISRILSALLYMESHNFAHNDIKPSNILIDNYGRPKLADFGLSKKMLSEHDLSLQFAGSLAFIAPEILSHRPYNPMKADIWSFGVLVYYMALGRLPFAIGNFADFKKAIAAGSYDIPLSLHPKISLIIRKTLVVDPSKRMSFQEINNLVEAEMKPVQFFIPKDKSLPPLYNSQNAATMVCRKTNKFALSKIKSRLKANNLTVI